MTINVANLELALSEKLNSLASEADIAIYAKAINQLRTGVISSVYNFSSLPIASTRVGELFFVIEDKIMYVATSLYGWVSIYTTSIDSLWSFGRNYGGVLGDGTTSHRSSPVQVLTSRLNWCQISVGTSVASGITRDAKAWTWGSNQCYVLGNEDCFLSSRNSPGTVVGGPITWKQIALDGNKTAAGIGTDGTLWTWGESCFGSLAGRSGLSAYISPGTTTGGGTNWCKVVGGWSNFGAIKTDGTLWVWGRGGYGGLGTGSTFSVNSPVTTAGGGTNWCHVDMSCNTTTAIKTDGTLWTWGRNVAGQLGNLNSPDTCSPGTTAGGGTNWCASSMGVMSAAGIKTDGTLWTWGHAKVLGDGIGTASRSSPGTTAGGGTNWCKITVGTSHMSGIKTDGTLWTWGCNNYGQLGDGTTTSRSSPGTTLNNTNWSSISSKINTNIGIRTTNL